MAKVISVMNEKGGCGKTAISLNVACGFANRGLRVLAIDNDPQHNLSSKLLDQTNESNEMVFDTLLNTSIALKNQKEQSELQSLLHATDCLKEFVKAFEEQETINLADVLLNPECITQAIQKTKIEHLDIVPSTHSLSVLDFTLKNMRNRDLRLRQAISYVDKDYDIVIIDNSPFESALTYNALSACYRVGDLVLIPSKMDYENWEGVSQTIQTTLGWITECGLDCDFRIIASMVSKTKYSKKAFEIFQNLFGDRMLHTSIRYQVAPIQTSSFSNQVLLDQTASRFRRTGVFQDFTDLLNELSENMYNGDD